MPPELSLSRRQIWAIPTPTTTALPRHCTPIKLPVGGLLTVGNDSILTLTRDAIFQPVCSGQPTPQPISLEELALAASVIGTGEPFYASTSPLIYAIAAATIVSYMLVIILFITPRTYIVGGAGGFLGQRRMMRGGGGGGSAVIGVGSRPWLQKIAALTVAISLTIATADTFKVANKQYQDGYADAAALTEAVVEGLEIRIVRVMSDTCLWLAQVQTLIRLFTRHKEKVMIKWIGFALIVFDTTFSILNYFVVGHGRTRARRFVDAIPALNYLFALALSLLYAAWVIYYSLCKRRYAFFHPKMRNIILVAMLALIAVSIPVVFFVVDISHPSVAGWGDYVRWVGAAAASVVVWEWVERIEALERDEKKDGILGREIFAGDEMLEVTPSTEITGPSSRWPGRKSGGRGGQADGGGTSTGWNGVKNITSRLTGSRIPPNKRPNRKQKNKNLSNKGRGLPSDYAANSSSVNDTPRAPVPVASPVSREDTTSAASTVYVVRYHEEEAMSLPRPPLKLTSVEALAQQGQGERRNSSTDLETNNIETSLRRNLFLERCQRIANSFRHGRSSPPPEVVQARADIRQTQGGLESLMEKSNTLSRPARFFDRFHPNRNSDIDLASLPKTVIPAPRTGIELLMNEAAERHPAQTPESGGISSTDTAVSTVGTLRSELGDGARQRPPTLSAFEAPQLDSRVGLSMTQTVPTQADIRTPQLPRLGSLLIFKDRSRSTDRTKPPSTTSPLPTVPFSSPQYRSMSASDHQTQLQSPHLRPRSLAPRQLTPLSDSLTTLNAAPTSLIKDATASTAGDQDER
ncbi:pH-response regulator protein palH/rim21 [Peltigera leucophlebia]|nr:pH-response regulator protein palH/rim21 [Peltigera leucophlebia]